MSRILRDAKLFQARLGQIDGAGNTGTHLIQLVEAKKIAAPEPEPEPEPEAEKEVSEPQAEAKATEEGADTS